MSFFVGGKKTDYENVKSLLSAVCSKFHGISCCQYIGEGYAGRFAQMIFGGLEYSILETISEAVMFLKCVLGFDGEQIHDTLCEWNESELGGYIMGVFADIVSCTDKDTGCYITEVVSDKAGYSKNVSRLSTSASELSVPISVINAAVYTRYLSKMTDKRASAAESFSLKKFKNTQNKENDEDRLCECIRRSCYLTILTAVSQSIDLLMKAKETYSWNMNVAEVFCDNVSPAFRPSAVACVYSPNSQRQSMENVPSRQTPPRAFFRPFMNVDNRSTIRFAKPFVRELFVPNFG
jgi:6-phosphogluconate dehydrogenase